MYTESSKKKKKNQEIGNIWIKNRENKLWNIENDVLIIMRI